VTRQLAVLQPPQYQHQQAALGSWACSQTQGCCCGLMTLLGCHQLLLLLLLV
jgi:hypothetical protein